MAIVLQVNFTPGVAHNNQTPDQREARARELANLPGLIWKVWISDAEAGLRGGIYLFADRASAKAWGDDTLRGSLEQAGATNISIRYFDVSEASSLITHATLARANVAAAA